MSHDHGKEINPKLLYLFMLFFILAGSLVTISNKMILISSSLGIVFVHIWFLSFITQIGKLCFIPIYYIQNKISNSEKNNDEIKSLNKELTEEANIKSDLKLTYLIPPALCDLTSAIFLALGLRFIPGSVFRMFTATGVIFTKINSVFILKNHFYRHHILAIFIVCIGLFLVGYATVSGLTINLTETIIGLVLTVSGMFFMSLQFTFEEKLMKKYNIDPVKAVGYEGLWGTIFITVLIIILQFSPCITPDIDEKSVAYYLCNTNENNEWTVENFVFAFKQMGDSGLICANVIMFGVSYCLMVYTGILCSNHSSSAARAVIDTARTIFVWAFFMMPFIELEFRESFLWLQFVGFIFLILGNLIYNEILRVPFFNLDYYTKKKIRERNNEIKNQEKLKGETMQTVSESSDQEALFLKK